MLQGKLQSEVFWITEREKGGVFRPEETCPKIGQLVLEVLRTNHPKARPPTARILEAYGGKSPAMVGLGIISLERIMGRGLILGIWASNRDGEPLPRGICRNGGREDTVAGGEY